MKIISPSFKNNEKIPKKYTADGENINPELIISSIPDGTKSLVLILDDPDAQRVVGYTWVHWVIFNIPVKGMEVRILENSVIGTQGRNTYKKENYGGPNPPKGTGVHNYHFRIYALNSPLSLHQGDSLDSVKKSMEGKILKESELIGTYWRD